jgi:hypothetical protein
MINMFFLPGKSGYPWILQSGIARFYSNHYSGNWLDQLNHNKLQSELLSSIAVYHNDPYLGQKL